MIGSATDTTDRATLNWLTGTGVGAWIPPTAIYLALLTANPATTAAVPTDPQLSELQELSATGYSRQAVVWNNATTPIGGQSVIVNSNNVSFGPFTSANGSGSPATFGALVTTSSGTTGEVIYTFQWSQPLLAAQNTPILVSAGAISLYQQ